MKTKDAVVDLPTLEQVEKERERLKYKNRYNRTLRSTIAILVVVAALAVLLVVNIAIIIIQSVIEVCAERKKDEDTK